MATYIAIDKNNVIKALIEWDGTAAYTPPAGTTLVVCDVPAGVDWVWDGTKATDPNAPPPLPPEPVTVVTARQARLALIQAGLYDQVVTAVNAADQTTQVWWQYSPFIERQNPILLAMATQLSLSPTQVDTLFQTASTL